MNDPLWLPWLRAWVGYETDAEKSARYDRELGYQRYMLLHCKQMFGQMWNVAHQHALAGQAQDQSLRGLGAPFFGLWRMP